MRTGRFQSLPFLCAGLLFAFNACRKASDSVIAQVGTMTIKESDIRKYFESLPCPHAADDPTTLQGRKRAMHDLVHQDLLLVLAQKQGLTAGKDPSTLHDPLEIYAVEERLFTSLQSSFMKAPHHDLLFSDYYNRWLKDEALKIPIKTDEAVLRNLVNINLRPCN